MATSSVDQTQAERPYVFFLFKGIIGIYEAWNENEYDEALKQALRLVVFLPTDIKEVLWPKKEEIVKELKQAQQLTGIDWYMAQLSSIKAVDYVARRYLEPFVDEMIRLLDEKQWLERGALRPQFRKDRRLRT